MKENYDLIVFDWDGTLIDSIDWIVECIQYAANQAQCRVPEAFECKDLIGLSLRGLMEQLYPEAQEPVLLKLMQLYSDLYLSRQIVSGDLFDGVLQTLHELRNQGFQLAVATGKTRRGLDSALLGTGMKDFFDATRCADETASKPDPKMLYEIFAQLGIAPERSIMVGDSAHDMAMANNAAIASVAVNCGVHNAETLAKFNPLHNLQHTTEILSLI